VTISVSITEDVFMAALRTFLLAIVPPGVEVRQTQLNRVPEPIGPNFILMTPMARLRLATNVETWDTTAPAPGAIERAQATQIVVQLDIHGPNGSDYAQAIATLARSEWGCINLDAAIVQPLYATDGNQIPFHNGEGQYENRWVMDIVLQATPSVSTPQDFAATLHATLIPTGA